MTPLSKTAARAHLGKLTRPDGSPVPVRTLSHWMRHKAVPHRKLGRSPIFLREELDAWFRKQGTGFFA